MRPSVDLLEVLASVDERKEELFSLLKTLIQFQTPSPPARNAAEAQQFMAGKLQKLGFSIDQWDVYPGDPNVVGVLKGSHADEHNSLIINGHIDVAEVDESSAWENPPFEPVIHEGRMVGRGTADMKGGLAGALFAIQLLREAQIDLPGDVIFQSVVGEEVGEAGTLE